MKPADHIESGRACIGCTTCAAVCPRGCVSFHENEQGFYAPYVDEGRCVGCGLCAASCPEKETLTSRDIGGLTSRSIYLTSVDDRRQSASGGVFYALACKALAEGGLVCGCVWDEGFVARHVCTGESSVVERMRDSKYVQSDLGDCFREIKGALSAGTPVLFSGTSCQTTALCLYLRDAPGRELLTTVALICGGVPSPRTWRGYKEGLERQRNAAVASVEMRSKCKGWFVPHIHVRFGDGSTLQKVLQTYDVYGANFACGVTLNEPCMHCPYKLDTVLADILIGDCWGLTPQLLSETRDMGISSAIALTERGGAALDALEGVTVAPEDLDEVVASHHVLTKDHAPHPYREEFFAREGSEDTMELLTELHERWVSTLPKGKFSRILYKTGTYAAFYKLRWRLRQR